MSDLVYGPQGEPMAKLYKKSSTGKIQEWTMMVAGDLYWSVAGQQGGKITRNKPTTAKPKNVGRSNETTPEQQAMLEALAKFQKKLDDGYTDELARIDEALDRFFRPMLAKEYEIRKGWDKKAEAYVNDDNVVFPALVQPKLDGIRLEKSTQAALSRKGKPLGGAFNVVNRSEELFAAYPDLKVDGELYSHEFKDEFEDLVSLIKKSEEKMDDEKREDIINFVQYHVYDVPCVDGLTEEDNFVDRMSRFKNILDEEFPDLEDIIKFVPWEVVNSHEEVDDYYQRQLDLGYEGAMLRYDLPYESNKRTWNLLKVKPFYDGEFKLLDIQEGEGNWAGKAKSVTVELPGGTTSSAGVKGKEEFCEEKFQNKENYIGKSVTVVYQGFTKYGKLRFGQVKAWDRESYE